MARYQIVPIDFLPSFVDPNSSLYAYFVIPFVAVAELCRRFMWAIFRFVATVGFGLSLVSPSRRGCP